MRCVSWSRGGRVDQASLVAATDACKEHGQLRETSVGTVVHLLGVTCVAFSLAYLLPTRTISSWGFGECSIDKALNKDMHVQFDCFAFLALVLQVKGSAARLNGFPSQKKLAHQHLKSSALRTVSGEPFAGTG